MEINLYEKLLAPLYDIKGFNSKSGSEILVIKKKMSAFADWDDTLIQSVLSKTDQPKDDSFVEYSVYRSTESNLRTTLLTCYPISKFLGRPSAGHEIYRKIEYLDTGEVFVGTREELKLKRLSYP